MTNCEIWNFSFCHVLYIQQFVFLWYFSFAKTVVRIVYGNSKCCVVKISMHQGSVLSILLFVIVRTHSFLQVMEFRAKL